MSDEDPVEAMEIDLEIAEVGEILQRHGTQPKPALVTEIWDWAEALRNQKEG
ncbi:Uncharacterised protein [Mycobacteroides abscessus subsp. massiliense]|uniref:hypothetical protein n=1 Tax=Mycobacteroides abscessus TaxID=36809 RepID=UPI0009CAC1EA|nr:hypothetical protein [Mycobacteroides abscessus]SLC05404.1 Uncharacterised protein [Mycobacteroides abscessus subsp. massiliense]